MSKSKKTQCSCSSKSKLTLEEKEKYKAIPSGDPIKTQLKENLFSCAQLYDPPPTTKGEKVPDTIIKTWMEDGKGKIIRPPECSCWFGILHVTRTCTHGRWIGCDFKNQDVICE